jgi:ABC-type metal ion transport system substrate-binding protein
VNVIVARQDNKNSQKVKNFVKAYESDEVEKKAGSFQRRSCKRMGLIWRV